MSKYILHGDYSFGIGLGQAEQNCTLCFCKLCSNHPKLCDFQKSSTISRITTFPHICKNIHSVFSIKSWNLNESKSKIVAIYLIEIPPYKMLCYALLHKAKINIVKFRREGGWYPLFDKKLFPILCKASLIVNKMNNKILIFLIIYLAWCLVQVWVY